MRYPSIISMVTAVTLVSPSVCLAVNNLPNPGFENQLEGWESRSASEFVTIETVPAAAHSGTLGLRVTDKDESTGSEIRTARFPVTPSTYYELEFWGRGLSGKGMGVYLIFTDANGNWLEVNGAPDGATLTLPAGETPWVPLSITAKAPAGAANAFVRVRSYSQALVTADVDDFSIRVLPSEEASKLRSEWTLSQQRVEEIADILPQDLSDSMCGPGIDNRSAWENFGKRAGPDIIERADRLLREPVPELTDELYLHFSKTGMRTKYEKPFRDRRVRLRVLTLAECITDKGKYLPAIEETLEAILSEKAWTLPSHDRNLDNFEGRIVDIDLGAAVRGEVVATSVAWLGDRLPTELREHAIAELDRRIFTPYLSKVLKGADSKLCWWTNTTSNWNPVCHSEVVMAAMNMLEDVDRRAAIIAGCEHFIKRYYDGFSPDGYCTEGLGYWNYGFGHYLLLAETLLRVTGGTINLYAPEIIVAAAQYPQRLRMAGDVYPSFADCPRYPMPKDWATGIIQYRYAGEIRDPEHRLIASAYENPVGGTLTEISVAAFPLTENDENLIKHFDQQEKDKLRSWFPLGGVLICRSGKEDPQILEVAIKGGHNDETHNHNDVGGFALALKGRSPVIDPGRDIYTGFDSYKTVDLKGSQGHSVPVIAGQYQQPGRYAMAEVISHEFTDETDTLVLDLSRLYDVSELVRLERTFIYSRKGKGSLTIIDTVEFSSPQTYVNAFITYGAITMSTDTSALVVEGPSVISLAAQTEGDLPLSFSIEPLKTIIPRPPLRMKISLSKPVLKASIRYEITPAQAEWMSYVENRDPEVRL